MPAWEYQQARDAAATAAANHHHPSSSLSYWIDGRPYLPQIRVLAAAASASADGNCNDSNATFESVKRAAASVLLVWYSARAHNNNNNNNRSNESSVAPTNASYDGDGDSNNDDSDVDRLVSRLRVEHYDGGVTNTLYKVTLQEQQHQQHEQDDKNEDQNEDDHGHSNETDSHDSRNAAAPITSSMFSARQCSWTANDLDQLLNYCVDCTTHTTNSTTTTTTTTPHIHSPKPNNTNNNTNAATTTDLVLLVRVFGAEGMIDRDQEASVFAALSSTPTTATTTSTPTTNTIAPPYYGRFGNGRVEGWMPHMRPLQTQELPRFARGIAHAMAVLHVGFGVPSSSSSTSSSSSSSVPVTVTAILSSPRCGERDTTATTEPTLFDQLYHWLDRAEQQRQEQQLQSTTTTPTARQLSDWIPLMRGELTWLQTMVAAVMNGNVGDANRNKHQEAIVFCHNDLLAANILCRTDDEATVQQQGSTFTRETSHTDAEVQLIDFEYGGLNYRAFDMANHFNEYAGGPPDCTVPNYKDHLPTKRQQRFFIECYLQATQHIRQQKKQCHQRDAHETTTSSTTDAIVTTNSHATASAAAAAAAIPELPSCHNIDTTVSEVEIDSLMAEVELFLLVNHLYWGLWAVNQGGGGASEAGGYDYTTYATQRIHQYWLDKANYISND